MSISKRILVLNMNGVISPLKILFNLIMISYFDVFFHGDFMKIIMLIEEEFIDGDTFTDVRKVFI